MGQTGNPRIVNYLPNDYASDSYTSSPQNWNFIQDKNGVAYIFNTSTILEFDGSEWKNVRNSGKKKYLFQTAKDEQGQIYVGGQNELGYLTPDASGNIGFVSLRPMLPDSGKGLERVGSMASIDNHIYFRTNKQLFKWDGKAFSVKNSPSGFADTYMAKERLFVREREVGLHEVIGDSLVLLIADTIIKDIWIRGFIPINDGYLIVSYRSGCFKFKEGSLTPVKGEYSDRFPNEMIQDVAVLPSGNIVLGTRFNGLVIIDLDGNILNIINTTSGLSDNTVLGVGVDHQGGLWACLNNGISYIEYGSPFRYYDEKNGLEGLIIKAVKEKEGTIWAITSNGLFYSSNLGDIDNLEFTTVRKEQFWDLMLTDNQVLATTNSGIYLFDKQKKNEIQRIAEVKAKFLHRSSRNTDRVWVGCNEGLGMITKQKEKWHWEGLILPFKKEINEILEMPDGKLYLSDNTHTLYRIDLAIGEDESYKADTIATEVATIHSLALVNEQLWLGTSNGLYVLSREDQLDLLKVDGVVVTDTSKWVGPILQTSSGLIFYDRKSLLQQLSIIAGQGLKVDSTIGKRIKGLDIWSMTETPEKGLLIATNDDIIEYHPTHDSPYLNSYQTLIRRISFEKNGTVFYGYPNSDREEEIRFPKRQSDVVLEFGAASYEAPEAIQYRYKLDGYDKEWSHWRSIRKKEYTNLKSGKYTFRVQAKNIYDIIGTDAVFSFEVLPPWYFSWWMYVLYILLIAGLIYGITWIITASQRKKILEQNQLLEQQNELNSRLQHLDALKDQFLANTSHELRTPLLGIIGITEHLYDHWENITKEELLENLSLTIASGKRLSSLVDDILDFSKLKNHELELSLKPLHLKALTEVVIKTNSPLITGKNIRLINAIPDDFPAVDGDENRIQQILYNLIGNAIKFTESGYIKIRGEVLRENIDDEALKNQAMALISVEDTGTGIPEDKKELIFQEFEQAEQLPSAFTSTGLGLSISKRLVELHNGSMWVESILGKGSTFYFTLPVSDKKPVKETVSNISRLGTQLLPEAPLVFDQGFALEKSQAQINILIVDDEPVNQRVFRNHLSAGAYNIYQAMNGETALKILEKEESIDLILLDVMMPGMSGYEVCRRIREKYLPSEMPVIMVTAKNQVKDLVQGFELGANDYLAKPFTKEEFLARVKTQLNLHRIYGVTEKFVPNEFLRALGKISIVDVGLGDHTQRKVTVLFSDIRNYTTLAEGMEPEDNFKFVNAYNGRMGPLIREHKGFVNQYLGDGIMAIFPEEPIDALKSAIAMQKGLQKYNERRVSKGRVKLRIGIGMHTGPLIMGIIGDLKRMDATTISDTVNTASRIESLTKYYGSKILLSEESLNLIKNLEQYHFRYFGQVQVKGKNEPLGVYECFDADPSEVFDKKLQSLARFNEALKLYFDQQIEGARSILQEIVNDNPKDKTAALFLNKAKFYLEKGMPDDWSNIEKMQWK